MAEVTKISNITEIYKKTAIACGLAVFFCSNPINAAMSSKSQAIVRKAKNLSLQRDRTQASKILRDYIESNRLDLGEKRNITKVLKKVSQMFYTAKALQEYEMARSVLSRDEDQAIDHFEESHKLESLNTKPILALARYNLKLGKCSKSNDWIDKAMEVNPFNQESLTLKLIVSGCLAEEDELEELVRKYPEIGSSDYYHLSKGQAFILDRKYQSALEELNKVKDKKIPEQYYFSALAHKAIGKGEHTQFFRKYLELCEAKDALKRKYSNDPRICGESEKLRQKIKLPAGESFQKVVK